MGRSRESLSEKRMFVMELGQSYRDLCHSACEGLYQDSFFEETDASTAFKRLRAVVQNANLEFAKKMLSHAPQIVAEMSGQSSTNGPYASVVRRARTLISSYRGKELPGTFNPTLVGQLFRELSQPWLNHTRDHTDNVWLCARTAVVAILEAIVEDDIGEICMKVVIDPALKKMQEVMGERLHDYMLEFRRQPITYNHYLTGTVQGLRHKRERDEAVTRCRSLFKSRNELTIHDVGLIADIAVPRKERNMDDLAAQTLADYAEAYYKVRTWYMSSKLANLWINQVALKRVIDEVAAHVIEPSILTPLPRILDSTKILQMPDDLIESIGGESIARMRFREALQAKLDILNRSNLICKVYAEKVAETKDSSPNDASEGSVVDINDAPEVIAFEDIIEDQREDLPYVPTTPVPVETVGRDNDSLISGSGTRKKKANKMAAKWAFAA